ncbi:MAG: histone deacetylase [Synoicihabitans sp.]
MVVFYDPRCLDYGPSTRPEQPARLRYTVPLLQERHPHWKWEIPPAARDEDLLRAHRASLLARLKVAEDFDADSLWFEDIEHHARRATGAAVAMVQSALTTREPAISLMRPPGHHATTDRAMGFCYLNHIAVAALHALSQPHVNKVAVWDFDAHHGNGTEAILVGQEGTLFTSVHQSPGYPGTGLVNLQNCLNWPVAPGTPRADHMAVLRESWDRVVAFEPDLVLVSAGFDAYRDDPITDMTLEKQDFATLGAWLHESHLPTGAVLEGGYSSDLPELVDAFLAAWKGEFVAA